MKTFNTLPSEVVDRLIENKDHYAYQVQLLIDFYNEGKLPQVESISVEPKYGYVASIRYVNGKNRIIYGHDPGFNAGSSESLAKDKGYTKFALREMGINCPEGDEFLLPWWADTLRQSDRYRQNDTIQTTDDAHGYIERSLNYPVYVKPVSGSQGAGVRKVHGQEELDDLFEEYNTERVKVALVEKALSMPDYRLLMFDGKLMNAYERRPLSIIGDGLSDIEQLVYELDKGYKLQGRDVHMEQQLVHIARSLGRIGLGMNHILPVEERMQLLDVSNLSAGGMPIDVSDSLHPHWVELSRKIAHGFNLQICGVDLACGDITSADSDYSIIEVNATPGARQFMASGEKEQEKLQQMFLRFFRTAL